MPPAGALGVRDVAVTCGAEGVLLGEPWVPARPGRARRRRHRRGRRLRGTIAARLALGASQVDAVRDGVAAAARSLGARGGTGWITG